MKLLLLMLFDCVVLPSVACNVVSTATGAWFAVDTRTVKDTAWDGSAIIGGETKIVLVSSSNAWNEPGGGSTATITWQNESGDCGTIASETTADSVNWTPGICFGTNILSYVCGAVTKNACLLIAMPESYNPIPDLGNNPSAEDVMKTLSEMADLRLSQYITNGMQYITYRTWATNVQSVTGGHATPQEISASPNAWLSFALGSKALIETVPNESDLNVDEFKPALEEGKFDFVVSVKDIEIGSEAAVDNLKKVFGLEGGADLDSLSSENVDITFGTPSDGKVKFTAGPSAKNANATTFFMKVKMTP